MMAIADLVPRQMRAGALGPLMAVAHASQFELDSIDVQMGFAVERPPKREISLPDYGPMTLHELPAVERMATCVRVGLPEHAHLVTARIARAIEATGHRLAGPSREVFLEPPRFDRMQDSVVEMQYPVEESWT